MMHPLFSYIVIVFSFFICNRFYQAAMIEFKFYVILCC